MRFVPALLLSAVLALTGTVLAQTGPSPVIGMSNFIHATDRLDTTVTFYKEVFGLATPPPPRPPNPAVPGLVNAPGAQFQVAVFRIPGATFGWELTNFGAIERKAGQARPTDPGATALILRVRDLDKVTAAIKKAGAPIVTRSGEPVKIGNARTVMFRDPDAFLVEVAEVDENTGATMGITVSNMPATLKFYRELLGFELTGEMKFAGDPALMDLIGAPASAQYRRMAGTIPGTNARIEFTEFKGVKSTPFRLRVPDPGCPALALRVTDLDGLLKRLKTARVKIVSAGGVPAQFSPTIRNIFVEDPDGFKVQLFQVQ
jgi:catechol 2,3-dioxygenase-like lactoylglutathione lyase family enzyme